MNTNVVRKCLMHCSAVHVSAEFYTYDNLSEWEWWSYSNSLDAWPDHRVPSHTILILLRGKRRFRPLVLSFVGCLHNICPNLVRNSFPGLEKKHWSALNISIRLGYSHWIIRRWVGLGCSTGLLVSCTVSNVSLHTPAQNKTCQCRQKNFVRWHLPDNTKEWHWVSLDVHMKLPSASFFHMNIPKSRVGVF